MPLGCEDIGVENHSLWPRVDAFVGSFFLCFSLNLVKEGDYCTYTPHSVHTL